jgi:hypothetical protein
MRALDEGVMHRSDVVDAIDIKLEARAALVSGFF